MPWKTRFRKGRLRRLWARHGAHQHAVTFDTLGQPHVRRLSVSKPTHPLIQLGNTIQALVSKITDAKLAHAWYILNSKIPVFH
jgi:hypothetical protein